MTIDQQDDKLESMLADPLLAKPAYRWSFSVIFVLVALFALKPLIINRIVTRAEAYSSYGLYKNAVRESKKAIFLDNENPRAWNALGSAYKSQGDVDNAVNTYLNAVNVDPANKIAHFRVAMIFALEQNYNRAIPHFEYIRFLGPEPSEKMTSDAFSYYRSSLEMLTLCYERTSRPEKLQKVIEELARTYPDYKKNVEGLRGLVQPTKGAQNN
ncbi:MAG: tetratricopeptide repeat protein [Sedimentisphaerales bacterium]